MRTPSGAIAEVVAVDGGEVLVEWPSKESARFRVKLLQLVEKK